MIDLVEREYGGLEVVGVFFTWVIVTIMVPFRVLTVIRHLVFRVPKKGTIILTTTHIGGVLSFRKRGV